MAIKIKGNIETLLDYKKVEKNQHPEMGDRCFAKMFQNNPSIIEAPSFPAETLSDECYTNMFANCNLIRAPKVSAKTLGFNSMLGFLYNNVPLGTNMADVYPLLSFDQDVFTYNGLGYITFESVDGSNFSIYTFLPPEDEITEPIEETEEPNSDEFPIEDLRRKMWDGEIEYSTDRKWWYKWNGLDIQSQNGKLYLRGINNTYVTRKLNSYECYAWQISCYPSSQIKCTGNLMNLLDYQAVASEREPIMDYACFKKLFSQWETLITPPNLPAMNLTPNCYAEMFSGCMSLIKAPELPATTLASNCYDSMFGSCMNLETAPKLPATTLEDYCYIAMFASCYNLKTAPELPATTLAKNCYEAMFSGCKFTNAPALPATELAPNCYFNMFSLCYELTQPPTLPATKMQEKCYYRMFYGDDKLYGTLNLPATSNNLATDCYQQMAISTHLDLHFSKTLSASQVDNLMRFKNQTANPSYTITCDL